MISQTWPASREQQGETLKAIETALGTSFFQALQTVEIPYKAERQHVARLIRDEQVPLTYCLARVLNENRLNLADLEAANRKKSYAHVVRCLDEAREAGAGSVSLIAGPRPAEEAERKEALKHLEDSLVHICRAAQAVPALRIVIEPLDIAVHKKKHPRHHGRGDCALSRLKPGRPGITAVPRHGAHHSQRRISGRSVSPGPALGGRVSLLQLCHR